ncbi:MAG: mannose-1-phosphate guanylyltransferase/mannose-6-phosphate isomerase [Pelagibacterales bacterium]|nr:mannose-1-phosphate guanylyltransferase/mannose-6-phosphate isomerase [Pelagibacterales bacterium]
MKVKPVILCGGSGTRLFPDFKKSPLKQFIDFGGWTLFGETLDRIKSPLFDSPIISTNKNYEKLVRRILKNKKIKRFKIILEPFKKNTAPAIISSTLNADIKIDQPILFLPSDHYLPEKYKFNQILKSNLSNLNDNNIFIFGIKPRNPSSDFGYLLNKKITKNINRVIKFIEKPNLKKAKKVIENKGCWNSGIVLARKDSIINNTKIIQKNLFRSCLDATIKSKSKNNTINLDKKSFKRIKAISFDYAILEKAKEINSIILNLTWSDLGSWKEIFNIIKSKTTQAYIKKNTYYRPWGNYKNFFKGDNFLLKELTINKKSSISLQKHHYRAEHWTVVGGKPKITVGTKVFFKKLNEHVFIPRGSIHRIENIYKEPVKIIEAQLGSILKETDIVRYQDVYGRVK